MNTYIVNKNTSLLALNAKSLAGGSSFLVYLSSTGELGQVVTIRDIDGFISSPQSIVISTVDCTFTDQTSTKILQQRFAYLTLQCVSETQWSVINNSAFMTPGNYSVRGLEMAYTNILSNASLNGNISTGTLDGVQISLNNSLNGLGPFFTSTVTVGGAPSAVPTTLNGPMYITGNMATLGSLSMNGQLVLFSSIAVRDTLDISGSIQVVGGITQSTVAGRISVSSLSTGYGLFVSNELSTGGFFQVFSGTTINRNLAVSTLGTQSTLTTFATFSTFHLSTNAAHVSRADLSVVDPNYVGITNPVVEIQGGLAGTTSANDFLTTTQFTCGTLAVTNLFSSPSLTQFILSNASMQNASGSLRISSITSGALQFSNIYGAGLVTQLERVAANTVNVPIVNIQYECISRGLLQTANTNIVNTNTHITNTSSLNLGNTSLVSDSFTLSSIFISSGMNGVNTTSIQIPNAIIRNGSNAFITALTSATSSITQNFLQVLNINSGNSSLFFSTSSCTASFGNVSSLGVQSEFTTSSLTGVAIQFGAPPSYSTLSPGGLYLTTSTISGLTSNTHYEYVSGLGTVYSPIKIKATSDRRVYMSLGNISSFSTSYLNISMNYRNDGGSSAGSSGFQIRNYATFSTLINFNANSGPGLQTLSLSNYLVDRQFNTNAVNYYTSGVSTYPLNSYAPYNVVAGGLGVNQLAYSQDSGVSWNPVSSPITTEVRCVAWGSDKWLAGGAGTNSLAYSYNGIFWYPLGTSLFTMGKALVWNDSLWVAGGTGTNTLAYSYDGLAWIGIGAITFTGTVNSVAWNGFMFIAVGAGRNTIAYSYNGVTWTGLGTTIFTIAGLSVAWGSTMWLAIGSGGNQAAYSYDGINWTGITTLFTGSAACIAWNGLTWLAGGQGTYSISVSSDGITWTPATAPVSSVLSAVWSDGLWVISGSEFATSRDTITWTLNTSPPFTTGYTLAVNGPTPPQGKFLYTTSDSRTLTYSLGGSNWRPVNSLISGRASSILWNGSMWVAGMLSGPDIIIYSNDGINWIGLGKILFLSKCNSVAWNGHIWVAVGDAGANTIAYSYNGRTWTGVGTSIFSVSGNGVAWANGIGFIATGSGTNTFAESPDGIGWYAIPTSIFTSGGKLAYNGSRWVSCGAGPNGTLAYSLNLTTWTAVTIQPFSIAANDVAWNGSNLWVAVGSSSNGTTLAYSPDGVVWTPLALPFISGKGIAWTGTQWFATGASSSNSLVYVSNDGINWSAASSAVGGAYTIASKVANPNVLLIGCGIGSTSLSLSVDGILWSNVFCPLTTSTCVVWNGTIWVAGGYTDYSFVLAYSNNGISWTGVYLPNMTAVYAISYFTNNSGVAKWIAVGEGAHTRAESANGIAWTSYAPGSGGFFTSGGYGIVGSNGWTAVGSGSGGILSTSDGNNWSSPANLFTTGYGVAANGKQIIAVGTGSNTIAVSYNGTNWITLGNIIFTVAYGVAYGANVWVAVGAGANSIAYSVDGLTWTGLGTTIFAQGKAIIWSGQQFVALGVGDTTIATSSDGVIWNSRGNYVFTAGLGIGSKSISPPSYSLREPRTTDFQSAGPAGSVGQTTVVKFSGIDAWDSRVSSTQGFTSNAYIQFAPTSTTGWFMMGLAENPTTTAFSHITFAISCNNGAVAIYQSGFFIQSYGTYNYGDTFTIIFTGTSVQYYRNNTLLRSAPRNVGAPLYMSSALYSVGIVVKDIDFHAVYTYVTSPVAQSTSGFLATVTPGPVSLAPIYFSLLTDLAPSLWSVSVSAGGNADAQQSSLYADIYFNRTLITTTNVLSNLYLTTPSTYTLNFSVPTTYAVVAGDTLNVKLQGNRTSGDSYIYTNSIGYSTVLTTSQPNPNTVEYLEFFHNTLSTGLQTSELNVWISPVSTHTASYINSNVGLVMNKSYIKWQNSLNGVTIENSYNDISARSLTYTGALYNASDSNLKHSIEYINPEVYMTAISELPLRRYAFNNDYLSTFNLRDRAQLGVITSEVEPIFPSMIRSAPFEHCGLESVNTVDRTQLRYAHLAATQGLIIRVSTLKAAIEAATKAT